MKLRLPSAFVFPLFLLLIALSTVVGQPKDEVPLATGQQAVVVGTTGPLAVKAGLEALKQGGSAADAAMAMALCQVTECAGSYVSFAGIFAMTYFDAATGNVHYLNACFNTPSEEKEPQTIPTKGTPSGRTALVPGFMAGVQASLDRFGKLPRQQVFAPAIAMAEKGFPIGPLLGRFISPKRDLLSRLPETKRVFTKEDGSFFAQGDHFRQPELAQTLKQVSQHSASYMYTGEWAKKFVSAVQKEGGKITLKDMQNYQATWEEPLSTMYRNHTVFGPGLSSSGGVALVEALHLLEKADLPKLGHYTQSPESLFWLMQISHCQVMGFIPPDILKNYQGHDFSSNSRLKKDTSEAIWKLMKAGKWLHAAPWKPMTDGPTDHSDGIVVVDRWGNVAAVTHSINTELWGSTGIFVDGVSIPDAACFQQQAIKHAGPSKRLPDPMCPLIVMRDNQPVLGSSAIGGGLHQKTLQVLVSILDFDMDAQKAVDAPAFMLPKFDTFPPTPQVEKDSFSAELLKAVTAHGQTLKELPPKESGGFRGYWVGVQRDPNTGKLIGAGTRFLPSVGMGY